MAHNRVRKSRSSAARSCKLQQGGRRTGDRRLDLLPAVLQPTLLFRWCFWWCS
jgi:hypothetical protein